MADNGKYSGLRDLVLGKLKVVETIPIRFGDKNKELVEALSLQDIFFVRILPFGEKVKLNQKFDEYNKEGGVNSAFNDDIVFIAWLLMIGIVDKQGEQIFTEQDVVDFCGKFWTLVYDMAWAVCTTNDITFQAKQNTVGNSEGTEPPIPSSGQPVASNPLLEG